MTKTARNKLTDVEIRKAARPLPKALSDGGNLYLAEMPNTGALKWRVTYKLRGKKATIWIGAYPKLALKDARKRRDVIEDQASKAIDPKVARKAATGALGMTFKQFVEAHGEDLAPHAPKSRKEWIAAMTGKVGSLADMQPGAITGDDVAAVVSPIWTSKAPTAKKRLAGIATVLRAARARGLITTPGWTNPASYRDSFSGLMKKPVHEETPRAAMAYADLPQFMADLRAQPGPLALALEWIVLTGVRAAEGLAATWGEIDREAKVWTIPAARMKGENGKKREHQVPITAAMLDVLDRVAPTAGAAKPTDFIFPRALPRRRMVRHRRGARPAAAPAPWEGDRPRLPQRVLRLEPGGHGLQRPAGERRARPRREGSRPARLQPQQPARKAPGPDGRLGRVLHGAEHPGGELRCAGRRG